MSLSERIRSKIASAFDPVYFSLINESDKHQVPAGSETHFLLVLVSSSFTGVSLIERQRKLYQILSEELKNGLHALSLRLMTSEEWEKKKHLYPPSPACASKSKFL